jgi:Flp pilus assembly pilin Flp
LRILKQDIKKTGGVEVFQKFVKEEKAQGAIEYILLAGGIIVAAVVIFAIYSSMTRSAATTLNNSTSEATRTMGNIISNEVANMTG